MTRWAGNLSAVLKHHSLSTSSNIRSTRFHPLVFALHSLLSLLLSLTPGIRPLPLPFASSRPCLTHQFRNAPRTPGVFLFLGMWRVDLLKIAFAPLPTLFKQWVYARWAYGASEGGRNSSPTIMGNPCRFKRAPALAEPLCSTRSGQPRNARQSLWLKRSHEADPAATKGHPASRIKYTVALGPKPAETLREDLANEVHENRPER